MKKDIRAYGYEELQKEMATIGEKAFRAKQIYEWLHVKLVDHFDEMTNLSKAFREKLEQLCYITDLHQEAVQISKIDGTRKYLFLLEDGNVIESVLMRYKHGNSVCISSQVGCRMGCRFCASTLDGLVREISVIQSPVIKQKRIKKGVPRRPHREVLRNAPAILPKVHSYFSMLCLQV